MICLWFYNKTYSNFFYKQLIVFGLNGSTMGHARQNVDEGREVNIGLKRLLNNMEEYAMETLKEPIFVKTAQVWYSCNVINFDQSHYNRKWKDNHFYSLCLIQDVLTTILEKWRLRVREVTLVQNWKINVTCHLSKSCHQSVKRI